MIARFNRLTAALLGITATFMVTATPTVAQDGDVIVRGLPEGTKMQMVPHRDLNLRLISNLNILNDRVGRAVRNVCDFEGRDNLDAGYRKCAEAAWAGARPQIHRAYLQANRLAYSR